jgi:choline kinase
MQTVKHVVIAAAGLGSRLGLGKPKCLIEVQGQTLLERQLRLVRDIDDVRVVVGFEEEQVIEMVKRIRRDVIICRNQAYRSTTTAASYALGARHLNDWCLFLDADIIFSESSFQEFVNSCKPGEPLIGITEAKTDDAVFTHLNADHMIEKFDRTAKAKYEWANLAWLPADYCESHNGSVYERIMHDLPVRAKEVVSFEVDTSDDLDRARLFAGTST